MAEKNGGESLTDFSDDHWDHVHLADKGGVFRGPMTEEDERRFREAGNEITEKRIGEILRQLLAEPPKPDAPDD
jgi:general stress protein YciG